MDTQYTKDEIDEVRELNDWLDDPQGESDNVPEAKVLMAAAWYATEDFIRNVTGECSSQHTRKDKHEPETSAPFTCTCCRYFHSIGPKSRALMRHAQ